MHFRHRYNGGSGLMLKSVYENAFHEGGERNAFLDWFEHDPEPPLYICASCLLWNQYQTFYTPLHFPPEVICWGLRSFCGITGLCCTVLFPGTPHFLGLEVQLRLSTCSTVFFPRYFIQFPDHCHLFIAGLILSHSAARILRLLLFWPPFLLYIWQLFYRRPNKVLWD